MSVQTALQFIKQLHSDEELKQQVIAIKQPPDLQSFFELGATQGMIFTVEDLKIAHKHDWTMRWLIYRSE